MIVQTEEGAEHGSGKVPLGTGALSSDLECPLEPHQGESDAARRDGAEDGLCGARAAVRRKTRRQR